MSETPGVATSGTSVEALRARCAAAINPDRSTVGVTTRTGESYGGTVTQFIRHRPKLTTAGVALAAGCIATRTNPVRWVRDRVHTAALTVTGALGGGVASWIALHAGSDALAQVAHFANLGTGLVETAVGAGLVLVGAWAGRDCARYAIRQRDMGRQTAVERAVVKPADLSLTKAATLMLVGAAIPHLVSKIKN